MVFFISDHYFLFNLICIRIYNHNNNKDNMTQKKTQLQTRHYILAIIMPFLGYQVAIGLVMLLCLVSFFSYPICINGGFYWLKLYPLATALIVGQFNFLNISLPVILVRFFKHDLKKSKQFSRCLSVISTLLILLFMVSI